MPEMVTALTVNAGKTTKIKGNTAQRTVRQMSHRFFGRLYSDDDAILYVSLGGTVQDDGKDGAQMMR